MPDDADAPIAGIATGCSSRLSEARILFDDGLPLQLSRSQRLGDRYSHGVELVIPGHLLGQLAAAVVLEHDEVPGQRQEPVPLAHPLEHHLQLGQMRGGEGLAAYRAPRLEPLPPCGECAHARLDSVRSDERRVEGEQVREFGLVGLDLVPGRPDRGLLVRRVLELDQTKRKAVDEQHDVRPPLVLAVDDSELVDRQPVVVGGVIEVEDGDLRTAKRAPSGPVLDRHAVHQHAVKRTVADFQRRAFRPGQLAEGVLQGFGRQGWIQPIQNVAQPRFQNDFAVVGSLRVRRVRGNVGPVGHLPPQAFEPFECGVFDLRLGEGRGYRVSCAGFQCPLGIGYADLS